MLPEFIDNTTIQGNPTNEPATKQSLPNPVAPEPAPKPNGQPAAEEINAQLASEVERLKLELAEMKQLLTAERQRRSDEDQRPKEDATAEIPREHSRANAPRVAAAEPDGHSRANAPRIPGDEPPTEGSPEGAPKPQEERPRHEQPGQATPAAYNGRESSVGDSEPRHQTHTTDTTGNPQSTPTAETVGDRPASEPSSDTGTQNQAGEQPDDSSDTPTEPIEPEILSTDKPDESFYIPSDGSSSYFKMSVENRRLRRELDQSRQLNLDLQGALHQANRNEVAGSIGVFAGAFATTVVHDMYGYTGESALGNTVAGIVCFGAGQLLSSTHPAMGCGLRNAGVGMLAMDGFKRLYRYLRSKGIIPEPGTASASQQNVETFPIPAYNPVFWQVTPSQSWWEEQIEHAKEVELPNARYPESHAPHIRATTETASGTSEERDTIPPATSRITKEEIEVEASLAAPLETAGTRNEPVASPPAATLLENAGRYPVHSDLSINTAESSIQQPDPSCRLWNSFDRIIHELHIRQAECDPNSEETTHYLNLAILFGWEVEACMVLTGFSEGPCVSSAMCRWPPRTTPRGLTEILFPAVPAPTPVCYLCPFDEYAPKTDPPAGSNELTSEQSDS